MNNDSNSKITIKEMLELYGDATGKTKFSFIHGFNKPVRINEYYSDFVETFITEISHAINESFFVLFGYSEVPEINAGCVYNGKTYYVTLNQGTLLQIYHYASILACNYKTIDLKKGFSVDAKEKKLNVLMKDEVSPDLNIEIELSSDPIDNILADYIAMIAVKFIIAHEIGHIAEGHLRYLMKINKGDSVKLNMSEVFYENIDVKVLQCLEIDADTFASCYLMSYLQNELIKDETLLKIVKDTSDIYKLVGISIHCVFYLIGFNKDQWKIPEKSKHRFSHPQALTRLNLILDVCRGVMKSDASESDPNKLWSYIFQGTVIAHRDLCDFLAPDRYDPQSFFIEVLGRDSNGDELIEYWKKIKPQTTGIEYLDTEWLRQLNS